MKLIVTRYRDRAELLACYEDTSEHGGLFVPTRRPQAGGAEVILDIRVPGLPLALMIRGQVLWSRRFRSAAGERPGMSVGFLPSECEKRAYLVAVIRGQRSLSNSLRRHVRLPLELPGCWRLIDDMTLRHCTISDISVGGAFLETEKLMPLKTPVVVQMMMPRSKTQHAIEGKVAWSSNKPEQYGMGISFKSRDMVGKRRIKELVRRLRDDLLGGKTNNRAFPRGDTGN